MFLCSIIQPDVTLDKKRNLDSIIERNLIFGLIFAIFLDCHTGKDVLDLISIQIVFLIER